MFIITMVVSLATISDLVGLQAQYALGRGGMYPVYSFLEDLFLWISIGLVVIGIIYWIIYFVNKNK